MFISLRNDLKSNICSMLRFVPLLCLLAESLSFFNHIYLCSSLYDGLQYSAVCFILVYIQHSQVCINDSYVPFYTSCWFNHQSLFFQAYLLRNHKSLNAFAYLNCNTIRKLDLMLVSFTTTFLIFQHRRKYNAYLQFHLHQICINQVN